MLKDCKGRFNETYISVLKDHYVNPSYAIFIYFIFFEGGGGGWWCETKSGVGAFDLSLKCD